MRGWKCEIKAYCSQVHRLHTFVQQQNNWMSHENMIQSYSLHLLHRKCSHSYVNQALRSGHSSYGPVGIRSRFIDEIFSSWEADSAGHIQLPNRVAAAPSGLKGVGRREHKKDIGNQRKKEKYKILLRDIMRTPENINLT